jgi:nicotinamidase-related amidase
MPIDPSPYLDPARTAIVNMECQERLLGSDPVLAGLAASAARVGLIENLAALFAAARPKGVRIYYATDERREDGFGKANNTFVHLRMPGATQTDGGMGPVMALISPQPADVVFPREQGLTGFFATGLDTYLRNTGVQTVIVTGVSLNIAVLGTCIEAMNRGYTVVVPSDCVASDPYEYAEHALKYTIRNIALVVSSSAIISAWA